MSCINKKYDREGGFCGITNLVCNCENGCPNRTDESPSYNSDNNSFEMFIDGKLETVTKKFF